MRQNQNNLMRYQKNFSICCLDSGFWLSKGVFFDFCERPGIAFRRGFYLFHQYRPVDNVRAGN
jgi:hypothetical protein